MSDRGPLHRATYFRLIERGDRAYVQGPLCTTCHRILGGHDFGKCGCSRSANDLAIRGRSR